MVGKEVVGEREDVKRCQHPSIKRSCRTHILRGLNYSKTIRGQLLDGRSVCHEFGNDLDVKKGLLIQRGKNFSRLRNYVQAHDSGAALHDG